MMRKCVLLLLCLLLVSACATTQERRRLARSKVDTGVAYLNSNDATAALKNFLDAQSLDPGNPEIHYVTGIAYHRKGRIEQAIEELEKATAKRSDFAEAHNYLGTLFLKKEQYDQAIREFQAALDNVLYETPEIALSNMGWAYYRQGLYKQALDAYRKAALIEPNRILPRIFMNTGIVYHDMERLHEAREFLAKAASLAPYVAEYRYLLGLYHLEAGDKPEAVKELNAAINIDPRSIFAQKAKDTLTDIGTHK